MAIVVNYGPSAATVGAVGEYAGKGQAMANALPVYQSTAQLVAQQGQQALQNAQFQEQLAFQAVEDRANRNQQVGMAILGGNINAGLNNQQFAQNSALSNQYAQQQSGLSSQHIDQQTDAQAQLAQQHADLQQRNWNIQNAPATNAPATFDADDNQQQVGHGQYLMPNEQSVLTNFQQANRNQQAITLPSQQRQQALQQKIQQGDPQAVQQGLQLGILRFSPQQKQEINRLQDAMSKLDRDPRFSPQDRAKAQQVLSQQLQSVRPMQVPPDEQPVDINTQIANRIGVWTNPTTGKTYPVTMDRNGAPRVFELPDETDKQPKTPPKPTTMRDLLASDPSERKKFYDDVRKTLTADSDASVRYVGEGKDKKEVRDIPLPTEDDVHKAMQSKIAMIDGLVPGSSTTVAAPGGTQTATFQSPAAPASPQQVQLTSGQPPQAPAPASPLGPPTGQPPVAMPPGMPTPGAAPTQQPLPAGQNFLQNGVPLVIPKNNTPGTHLWTEPTEQELKNRLKEPADFEPFRSDKPMVFKNPQGKLQSISAEEINNAAKMYKTTPQQVIQKLGVQPANDAKKAEQIAVGAATGGAGGLTSKSTGGANLSPRDPSIPVPLKPKDVSRGVTQADADEVNSHLATASTFASIIPGLKDDVDHVRAMIDKHGYAADLESEVKGDHKTKLRSAMETIGVLNETMKQPWQRPAKKSDLAKGAVYNIKGPDGNAYRAIWNGQDFVSIGAAGSPASSIGATSAPLSVPKGG